MIIDIEKFGEILANETINISEMDMKTNKLDTIDKQKWLYLHLGFFAGIKLMGVSDEDGEKVMQYAQNKLTEIEFKYGKKR